MERQSERANFRNHLMVFNISSRATWIQSTFEYPIRRAYHLLLGLPRELFPSGGGVFFYYWPFGQLSRHLGFKPPLGLMTRCLLLMTFAFCLSPRMRATCLANLIILDLIILIIFEYKLRSISLCDFIMRVIKQIRLKWIRPVACMEKTKNFTIFFFKNRQTLR
jgi:hypothetical protein